MQVFLHQNDLPDDFEAAESVAIDTETMGLKHHRDRLCLVQLSNGDDICHLVHLTKEWKQSPNLARLLKDNSIQKIFHFARFDVAKLYQHFGIMIHNIYCTKIASKLVRTYAERHGLKDLCREFLGVEISKQEQMSDWGAPEITLEQQRYAATDVLYLHALREKLEGMLVREGRSEIAQACFQFIPHRVLLDLTAGEEFDILSH